MKKIIPFTFSLILASLFILNIISADQELSYSERRELKDFPELNWESILNGDFIEDFEKYALDQFVFRDIFRSIHSYTELYGFQKKDVNNIYLFDEHLIKRVDEYRPDSVTHFAKYIQKINDTYLENANIYFAIVPDKNYFTQCDKFTVIDYDNLVTSVNNTLEDIRYIDLMSILSLDDYYRTDTHWKQEKLSKVIQALDDAMHFKTDFAGIHYKINTYEEFSGVYLGQSALNLPPDNLFYLESPIMKNLTIIDYQHLEEEQRIYETDLLDKMDPYDVFLGGATPLLTISNPEANTSKELIIFRDSFGSSLAPLLVEEYATITLIDTRYISSSLLEQYIEFNDQDVLFIYNTEVINNSQMLK